MHMSVTSRQRPAVGLEVVAGIRGGEVRVVALVVHNHGGALCEAHLAVPALEGTRLRVHNRVAQQL